MFSEILLKGDIAKKYTRNSKNYSSESELEYQYEVTMCFSLKLK